MQQFYPVFWFFFAILMLTRVLPFFITLFRLLRFEFSDISFARLPSMDGLSPLHTAAVAEVTALGFEVAHAYTVNDGYSTYTAVLFRHPSQQGFANLYLRPGGFLAYPVWFWSFTQDGKILMTGNRQPTALYLPDVQAEDAYAPTLQKHWEAHQARMAQQPLATPPADEAFARITGASAGYLRHNIEAGQLAGGNGKYFLTFRAAFGLTLKYMRNRRRLARPYTTIALSDAYRSAFYAETYEVYDSSNKRIRARRAVSAALLLLSGIVSTLLFAWWLGWQVAAAVIAVLIVHEGGHALAMRLFGYRDMNMFFIPFMGAVVTGKAQEVPVWKQAIVLLAGPVPGFLFALWAPLNPQIFPQSSFWFLLAINAALINLFNLLPLAFLDGGKLVEITLLGRFPFALVVFDLLSVIAMAAIMLTIKSYNMLFFIFFMMLTLIPLWRTAKLRAASAKETAGDLTGLFALAERVLKKKSFAQLYYVVRSVFEKPHTSPPRRWEIAFALALYFAVWGAAGAVWLDWRHDRALEAKFDQALRSYYQESYKATPDQTKAVVARVQAAAMLLPPENPRQIDAMAVPAFRLDGPARQAALERIIALHRNGHSYSRGALVETYLSYSEYVTKERGYPERIAAVEAALARMEALAPDLYAQTVRARLRLAELRDLSGAADKAQEDLAHLLVTTADADNCRCAQQEVAAAQAWFDIDKGNAAKAAAFLETPPYAAMTAKPGGAAVAYGWALLESGRTAEGLAQMKKAAPYYADEDPYEAENLDLIYAYWRAGETAKAASLIPAKFRKFYCDADELEGALYDGQWHGRAVAAIKAAMTEVCASTETPPKPASP